jgi:S-(hydroxymethyl)glutathione dehydrogenase/alcohol dehydrogenase
MNAEPVSSATAITDGRGGFVIDRTEVRAPLAGEVRVRIAAAGICHTDYALRSTGVRRV